MSKGKREVLLVLGYKHHKDLEKLEQILLKSGFKIVFKKVGNQNRSYKTRKTL